jgi:hypothetical protein
MAKMGSPGPWHMSSKRFFSAAMVVFYLLAILAQSGKLRNGDPAIAGISIDDKDEAAIAAFLQSLDEEYD